MFKGVRDCLECRCSLHESLTIDSVKWCLCRCCLHESLTIDSVKRGWEYSTLTIAIYIGSTYKCHLMPIVKDVVDEQTNTDLSGSLLGGSLAKFNRPMSVGINHSRKLIKAQTTRRLVWRTLTLQLGMSGIPENFCACGGNHGILFLLGWGRSPSSLVEHL